MIEETVEMIHEELALANATYDESVERARTLYSRREAIWSALRAVEKDFEERLVEAEAMERDALTIRSQVLRKLASTEKVLIEAYDNGFKHGFEGAVSRNICVHQMGTQIRMRWMEGYSAGERKKYERV